MSAAAFALTLSGAQAADVEDVLRQLPLKGVPHAAQKEAPAVTLPGRPRAAAGHVQPFVLTAVRVDGSTVFAPDAFAPHYAAFIGRTVDGAALAKIAEDITAMYRDAGFFLSRAIIPVQDVAGGILKVEIVEGFIADIAIEGDAPRELLAYADELKAERPASIATLERTLALMSDVAGVRVKASRMAGDTQDLSRHTLIVVADSDPIQAFGFLDNRGKPEAGEMQAYMRAGVADVLSFGDRLSVGAFFTPDQLGELWLGEVNYQAALGYDGTFVTLNASLSRNDQGDFPPGLSNESESARFFAQFTHPLIRSRAQSLWLHAGVEKLHIRSETAGTLAYQDDLAVAHAAATLRQAVGSGVATVYAEISGGFQENGLSTLHSTADADGRFLKGSLQATIVQPLPWGFSVYGELWGQVSDRPLLSPEEFAVGGSRIGRAFDTAEISGDDGVAGIAELRFTEQVSPWLVAQLYGFYDAGRVWNDNALPGFEDAALTSTGAGMRLSLPWGFRASYEAAKPLTRTPIVTGDRDTRHFVSLSWAW